MPTAMIDQLAKYLSEHIYKDRFNALSIEEARERVEAHATDAPDDTYVALLTDREGPVEVYGLGVSKTDVLDYGSDLLYQGRIPTAVIHWDGEQWDKVEVDLTMRLA